MSGRVEDRRWKARTDGGGIQCRRLDRGAVWYIGSAQTPYGIVQVYSQGFEPGERKLTWYRVVAGGTVYMRRERGVARRPRGLAIMAVRFAREITRRHPPAGWSRDLH